MVILSSPRFEQHVTPPGHPERPERAYVFDVVAARWTEAGGSTITPRPASLDELALVHELSYLERIAALSGRPAMLDADTFVSPDSNDIARLAAGAAVQAAEHSVTTREPAFALVRPPGHHAERDRAMGFCLYNNIAIAAAVMRARGLRRIAIVDIDVHHGNGTQAMFYSLPEVLYISTHQYPFYPGTGGADEIGTGEGRGFTVNIPMDAGATDADFDVVHREVVLPILGEFQPELVLVSAGYDAHERDPLASMRMTTEGYARTVQRLRDVSAVPGTLALVTEGGYELTALAACLEASLEAIASKAAEPGGEQRRAPAPRGERAVQAARAVLAWNIIE
jgi:acetoin utilization deacetylase AcuC-like enzyme